MFSLNCCIVKVKNLELQCHEGDEKMQKCRQKIEEAWSVAREEAAKCKAAKEIIKALALRVISHIFLYLLRYKYRLCYTHSLSNQLFDRKTAVVVPASYDVGQG